MGLKGAQRIVILTVNQDQQDEHLIGLLVHTLLDQMKMVTPDDARVMVTITAEAFWDD